MLKLSISLSMFPKFPDSVSTHTLLFFLSEQISQRMFFCPYMNNLGFCHPNTHLYHTNVTENQSANSRQDLDLQCFSRFRLKTEFWRQHPVSDSVFHLSVVHYFLLVETVFKKHMLISTYEWCFHIFQHCEDSLVYCKDYQNILRFSKYLKS